MKILTSTYGRGTVNEFILKNTRTSRKRNLGIVAASVDGRMQEISIQLSERDKNTA
jgi:hypothetical protein